MIVDSYPPPPGAVVAPPQMDLSTGVKWRVVRLELVSGVWHGVVGSRDLTFLFLGRIRTG